MKYIMFTCLLTGLLLQSHNLTATTSYTVKRPMQTQQTLTDAYHAKGILYKPRTEHLNPDGSPRYINRLILEDSPYLLQHAHNPVDWHAWGEAAFELAQREDKPIFLSIGYSTCHWCHVMERESFENTAIAKLLNDHFVAIKVDRESHPDVDEVYMTAVMLMTGQGGWPMSSFLTPDGKPFFAGTYFPPQQFGSVLMQIVQLWQQQRRDVLEQASRVTTAVEASNNRQGKAKALDTQVFVQAARQILQGYDELLGGFSQAPKFPHEPWLYLLLNLAERTHDPVILDALEVTLDAMARGGIYDQVGGGFHRYSTDPDWLVPHFEKMLYNQAHLARVYLQAWRLTGKEKYRRVVIQILDYVAREMTAPDGGFYSATDADSEGEEGAFFIWTPEQIQRALTPEDAALAIKLYSITQQGNFEGRNILHLTQSLESFAEQEQMAVDDLRRRVDQVNETLYATRESRPHPLRDDKIITAWNGMMISAFAQAADLLSSDQYRQVAERAGAFIWQHNRQPDGRLWRVHLDGQSSVSATLEDYAYLAEGMLHLYDLNRDASGLERAQELTSVMLQRFLDGTGSRFFMSEAEADITAMSRPRDSGSDNAIPSGTSVAMRVLQMLWQRTGNIEYRLQLDKLISSFASTIEAQPNGYAYMLTAIDDRHHGELTRHAYAAQGGIRVDGSLHPLGEDKQLLRVKIGIPEGWHINANRPNQQDLIPTELKLAADATGWRLAPVTYPEGTLQTLAFQSDPMAVYENQVQLEVLVEGVSSTSKSPTLPVELSLQACNNEVCLAPERLKLWIHQAK